MLILIALLCGILFGFGLMVSGMSNPEKVLGFLDLAGDFDPSLMFVMAGAVAVTFVGFPLVLKLKKPFFDQTFQVISKSVIDRPLILGAVLFGVGWGLAGYCPGPGFTQFGISMIQGEWVDPLIFLIGLIAGSLMLNFYEKR